MIIEQRSPYLLAPVVTSEAVAVVDVQGSTTTITYSGMTFTRSAGTDYHNDFQLSGLNFDDMVVSYSGSPVTLSVNHLLQKAGGTSSRIAVRFNNGRGETRNLYFDFSNTIGGVAYSNPKTLIPGTYAKYSFDRVFEIFDTLDNGTSNNHRIFETDYTRRNTSVVPHASLTCQSVNAVFGGQKRFIAITPRHVIGCGHYGQHPIGTVARFLDMNGVLHTRTAVAAWNGLYDGNKPFRQDFEIWLLNEDLPESIVPAPLVGDWFYNIVGSKQNYTAGVNAFGFNSFNQDMHISPAQFSLYAAYENTDDRRSDTIGGVNLAGHDFLMNPGYHRFDLEGYQSWAWGDHSSPFFHNLRAGDSGSPVFVPVDGGWASASIISGHHLRADAVNALIKAVDAKYEIDTGYTVTVAPQPVL
jgi:hypothetical protein